MSTLKKVFYINKGKPRWPLAK